MAATGHHSQPLASRSEELRASPPMFESRLFDMFSRVHPVVPVVIFLPVIVFLAIWGLQNTAVLGALGLFAGGYVLWTLFEYWLHRVVFHFEPEGKFGERLHWIIHGVHHKHPNDPLRLMMPPGASVPLGAAVFGLICLIFGFQYAPGIGAGFFAGYLAYDMLHYYLHHFTPQGRLGKRLRELHMRHHFRDHTTGFGISAPYWDWLFGTFAGRRRRRSAE